MRGRRGFFFAALAGLTAGAIGLTTAAYAGPGYRVEKSVDGNGAHVKVTAWRMSGYYNYWRKTLSVDAGRKGGAVGYNIYTSNYYTTTEGSDKVSVGNGGARYRSVSETWSSYHSYDDQLTYVDTNPAGGIGAGQTDHGGGCASETSVSYDPVGAPLTPPVVVDTGC